MTHSTSKPVLSGVRVGRPRRIHLVSREQIDILDRQGRIFARWKALVALLNPFVGIPKQANVSELMDFLTDEYDKARPEMRRSIPMIVA